MRHFAFLAPLLALGLVAPPAIAAGNNAPRAAAIPFANHDGIRDWVAVGDKTVYVQDNFRRWYRATLFAPSMDLQFVQAIGFDTGPIGTLDKWSTLVIHGRRYPITTFERVDAPPMTKAQAQKAAKAAQAAKVRD
jgi:hypothetical protein